MSFKLLKDTDNCVSDFLKSFSLFNNNIVYVADKNIIVRKDLESIKDKVGILSGGGGGHEPAHAGFVGMGMLSAAVSGNVFAAPSPNLILDAILQIGKVSKCGVLLVVANYTGDKINFSIASERAKKRGLTVDMVFIGEDTALKSLNKAVGRRGLAGIILINKIAGAMSEKKCNINEIKNYLNKILELNEIGTIGISFNGCTPPGTSKATFNLSNDMFELGLGIHGEAGVKKVKYFNMQECVKIMVDQLTSLGVGHLNLKKGENIVLLVNNLGSCTIMEMFSITEYIIKYMENRFYINIVRGYCGTYVTSLEMYGFSITILKVIDNYILDYLDAPTNAPGWTKLVYTPATTDIKSIPEIINDKNISCKDFIVEGDKKFTNNDFKQLIKVVEAVCESLIVNESYLNELDREIGDSDCGSTFRRGAQALKNFVNESSNHNLIEYPRSFLSYLSYIIETHMGGSSGGLLSLYFEAISSNLNAKSQWNDLFLNATKILSEIGGACEGDRTMLDVLFPVCIEWNKMPNDNLKDIILKLTILADKSSKATINMVAKAGRASYVGESSKIKGPDPGAEAISIIIKAISKAF